MADGQKSRRLRNLLVQPRKQLRVTFLILSLGILSMATLTGYFAYYLNVLAYEVRARDPISAVLLEDFVGPMLAKLVVGQVLLWGISVVLGVIVTHRIFGPMIPIVRHIRKLAGGDYGSRVKLRGNDELSDLAEALNDLAASLEKKK